MNSCELIGYCPLKAIREVNCNGPITVGDRPIEVCRLDDPFCQSQLEGGISDIRHPGEPINPSNNFTEI